MSLNRLVPALILASARETQSDDAPGPSQTKPLPRPLPPLARALAPLLQTPRAITQKYRTRLARLLAEEDEDEDDATAGAEHDMMCFALKYDKGDDEDGNDEDEASAEEHWRRGVLDRMEKRE